MNKRMSDLIVELKSGEIHLTQSNQSEEMSVIVLHPDQIEVVAKWLMEAKRASNEDSTSALDDSENFVALVKAFLDNFELVFDRDWEFTVGALREDSRDYIKVGSTFTEPGVDDESNNWGNRGSLLFSYRELRKKLNQLG